MIVIGQVCVILCGIAFGFTFSFEWAVAVRMLSGVMNGIVGTAKASASEVCPEHLQGRAMSYITTSWGVGLIVGPALGGILSEPATKIPSLFPPDGLFAQFPFLLPMLAVSVLTFLAMICTIVYLPETLHRRPAKQAARDPVPSTASAASTHASASSTSSADASPRGAVLVDLDLDLDPDSDQSSLREGRGSSRGWDAGALTTSSKATPSDAALGTFDTPHRPRPSQRETPASLRTPSQAPTRALQVDPNGEDALSSSPTPHQDRRKPSASASAAASALTSSSSPSTLATVRDPHGDRRSLLRAEEEESSEAQSAVAPDGSAGAAIVAVKAAAAAAGAVGTRRTPPKARPRLLCFRLQPMLILVVYTVLSLSSNMMDEILPLWALAERRQYGLGMTSTEVGISLTITGGLITLFQLFVYPPMSSRFSLLAILKATSILQVPFMCAFPLLYYVTQPVLFWAALIALNFFKAALAMCNFITISILTNNSVPRAERGTANGLGMTMASTGRAVGPALGGNILAWSLTNGLPWPLSYHFGFYFCALVVLSIYATLLSISETLNHPLPEDDEDEDEGVIETTNNTLASGARSSEDEEEVVAAPTSRGRAGGAGELSLHDKDGSVRALGSGAAVRSSEVELAGRTLATTRYEIGDDDSDNDGDGEHEGEGKEATGGKVSDSRRSLR